MYKIFVYNPKDKSANDKVFSENPFVIGIEVTTKEEAEKCKWNIDPQHGHHKMPNVSINVDGMAAIEVAMAVPEILLPPGDSVFFTTRADLDSFGTAAVFAIRSKRLETAMSAADTLFTDEQINRIMLIAETDKFSSVGEWKPYPLPSHDNPWPTENSSTSDRKELAAINAAITDFRVAPQTRLQLMIDWILTGYEPFNYRLDVDEARLDMICAIEDNEIKLRGLRLRKGFSSNFGKIASESKIYGFHPGIENFDIAVVESTHRAATMVGYSVAPVVVAYHPEWNKFTICQFREGYVNFSELKARLNQLEKESGGAENATWGGSNTIAGSPQVEGGTKLGLDDVLSEVIKLYR